MPRSLQWQVAWSELPLCIPVPNYEVACCGPPRRAVCPTGGITFPTRPTSMAQVRRSWAAGLPGVGTASSWRPSVSARCGTGPGIAGARASTSLLRSTPRSGGSDGLRRPLPAAQTTTPRHPSSRRSGRSRTSCAPAAPALTGSQTGERTSSRERKVRGAALQACPALSVLAISWEVLHTGGEADYRVPSLSLPPDPDALPQGVGPLATLAQCGAAR